MKRRQYVSEALQQHTLEVLRAHANSRREVTLTNREIADALAAADGGEPLTVRTVELRLAALRTAGLLERQFREAGSGRVTRVLVLKSGRRGGR